MPFGFTYSLVVFGIDDGDPPLRQGYQPDRGICGLGNLFARDWFGQEIPASVCQLHPPDRISFAVFIQAKRQGGRNPLSIDNELTVIAVSSHFAWFVQYLATEFTEDTEE